MSELKLREGVENDSRYQKLEKEEHRRYLIGIPILIAFAILGSVLSALISKLFFFVFALAIIPVAIWMLRGTDATIRRAIEIRNEQLRQFGNKKTGE